MLGGTNSLADPGEVVGLRAVVGELEGHHHVAVQPVYDLSSDLRIATVARDDAQVFLVVTQEFSPHLYTQEFDRKGLKAV